MTELYGGIMNVNFKRSVFISFRGWHSKGTHSKTAGSGQERKTMLVYGGSRFQIKKSVKTKPHESILGKLERIFFKYVYG